MKGLHIFDTEADGLVPEMTKFHCLLFKEYDINNWNLFVDLDAKDIVDVFSFVEDKKDDSITIRDMKDFPGWLKLSDLKGIACHNIFGYDLPAFKKIFKMDYSMKPENLNGTKLRLFDTLSMSRCLHPDRRLPAKCPVKVLNQVTGKKDTIGAHGLQSWGYRLANLKVEITDWRNLPLVDYVNRVYEDVVINELTFTALMKESNKLAKGGNIPRMGLPSEWKGAMRLNNKGNYLMCQQEIDGILFDEDKAWKLLDRIDIMMDALAIEVEAELPMRLLPKSERPEFPSEPFKKDGSISSYGYNWLKRLHYKINEEAFDLIDIPKNPFKKDGSLSAHGIKFCDKMELTGDDDSKKIYINDLKEKQSKIIPICVEDITQAEQDLRDKKSPDFMTPMLIANQGDIKRYLIESEGWKPTIWNTKDGTRDIFKREYSPSEKKEQLIKYIEKTKCSIYRNFIYEEMELNFDRYSEIQLLDRLQRKARYLVTSPKLKDERGELCPSLEMLQGEMAKKIVKWLSLRNRRSVIKSKDEKKNTGWLNNPRLKIDGRLGQGFSGHTNTNRYKHRMIVNLPKASPDVLLGKEMRGLFIAPKGKKILGYDGSNLEQFVAGSYAWLYDGGKYAETLAGDSHTTNAKAYSIACGREITRSSGKNVTYAVLYGAQAAKVAKMLGIIRKQAQSVIDAFWQTNYGLKKLKEALEAYWESTGKRYIRGIDGRKIYTRSKHSLVNALFQSCGAILMEISGCFMYDMLVSQNLLDDVTRMIYSHDEYQYEVPDEMITTYEFDTKEEANEFSIENKLLSNVKNIGDKWVRYYCVIGELGNLSLKRAGEYLKMPLPFRADYDIGLSLADTH